MAYEYLRRDLKENPEDYFYSNLYGENFFKKWFETRSPFLKASVIDFGNWTNLSRYFCSIKLQDEMTQKLIADIEYLFHNTSKTSKYNEIVKFWVRTYEIKKKIPMTFDELNLKRSEIKVGNPRSYMFLAFLFYLAYMETGSHVVLNCFFKLIDILLITFGEPGSDWLFEFLVNREVTIVEVLLKEHNISWER